MVEKRDSIKMELGNFVPSSFVSLIHPSEETMTRGVVVKEKGVLKLVHPGGFAEMHREPITAREVMAKNPQHCIARPDFFKFPLIVVRPESVLEPGRVFYIIPNRTIYTLLKAYRMQNVHSLSKLRSPKNHDHLQYHSQPPVFKSGMKVTPTHKYSYPCLLKQQAPEESWAGVTSKHQDHDQCIKEQFPVESCAEVIPEQQDHLEQLKQESLADSWVEVRSSLANDYGLDDVADSGALPSKDDKLEFECGHRVTTLKSCLKKHGDKSHCLRVTFALPEQDYKERKFGRMSTK